jgi:hypothetical protein
MEIALHQNSSFQDLLKSNKDLERFRDLLSQFLRDAFFPHLGIVPVRVDFEVFQDPEATIDRPMVEIVLSQNEDMTRSEIQRAFISQFKSFLANAAEDSNDFVTLRQEQRQVMIIFTFE